MSPHRVAAAAILALAIVGLTRAAHADAKDTARQHLRAGVALFQAQSYAGALAEFESSFRALPTAAALQNIALCQTRLDLLADAVETLQKLQRDFDSSLSPADRDAIQKTLKDLLPKIGSLTLRLDPPGARVSVDGHAVDATTAAQTLRLAPGEHHIAASAPSHASVEIAVTLAAGETKQVDLLLPATAADVSVLASDPSAAIAVDREPKSYGAWSGSLLPGTHLFQIYRSGYKQFATYVAVRAGEQVELRLPLGPADASASSADSSTESPALPYAGADPVRRADEPPPKGFYGLIAATNTSILQSPDGFTPKSNGDASGGFFGLRAGYRFNVYFAFEGLFETGGQDVDGTLANPANPDTPTPTSYELTTRRYGGNVRLLAGGRSLRFSGTFGVGAVHHTLVLADVTYKGINSYFGLEVGPQVNMGKAILELTLQSTFEGTTSVRANGVRAYSEHTIVPQAGIGLRVGYGEWGRW